VRSIAFELCWIAGRRHACLGGSIQSHKNKDSLYGRKSLESGRIRQIVYKYRAFPTVRSIDFIIPMHHSKSSIPQVDKLEGIYDDPRARLSSVVQNYKNFNERHFESKAEGFSAGTDEA
jgi:hypothetical protein